MDENLLHPLQQIAPGSFMIASHTFETKRAAELIYDEARETILLVMPKAQIEPLLITGSVPSMEITGS